MKTILLAVSCSLLLLTSLSGCHWLGQMLVLKRPDNPYVRDHRRPCGNPLPGDPVDLPENSRCGKYTQ